MATGRASLASHDLSDFHIPIPPRDPQQRAVEPATPDSEPVDGLRYPLATPEPSMRRASAKSTPVPPADPVSPLLARGRREKMISLTFRVPYSLATDLDEITSSSGVGLSELIRAILTKGIQEIKASKGGKR